MGDPQFGKAARNFAPRTIWTGDNLDILRGLNSETVDLIYLDPPFNSNRNYSAPVGSKAAEAAFKDTWTLSDLDLAWIGMIADQHPAMHQAIEAAGITHSPGMKSYLCMMAVRLMEMQRVLKPDGSVYLHCDPTASAYLRMLMDSVFGRHAFRNEIVWSYQRWTGATRHFQRMHDVVLFYARSKRSTFNQLTESYSAKSRHSGRRRTTVRPGGGLSQEYTGDIAREKAMRDVWEISYLNSMAKERVGFPTQKPLALLNRIIEASSDPGDVVLDPFCGCATACVAADNLQREWLGIDISSMAVELVHRRLRETLGDLYHASYVTERTDVPQRTDIETPINYRQNRHVLFGEQEGKCNGCQMDFPFKMFEVDHVVPQARGGTDHKGNLQLLCSPCNRIKGDRPMEYLMARLAEYARPA